MAETQQGQTPSSKINDALCTASSEDTRALKRVNALTNRLSEVPEARTDVANKHRSSWTATDIFPTHTHSQIANI